MWRRKGSEVERAGSAPPSTPPPDRQRLRRGGGSVEGRGPHLAAAENCTPEDPCTASGPK